MAVAEIAERIVIFLSEDDHCGRQKLYEAIIDHAREDGIAGATVWRGIEGYGASKRIHTAGFSEGSRGLPVAIEVLDAPDRVDAFLPVVRRIAPYALVIRQEVRVAHFPSTPASSLDDLDQ